MRRQGFAVPNGILHSGIFQPLAWTYVDKDTTVKVMANTLEQQLLPPFVNLPPEPEDAAFQDCRLEVLIQKAQQEHIRQMNRLAGIPDTTG